MDTPTEIKDCGLELTFICTESAGVRYSVRKLMRRMRWGIILLITINMETENEYIISVTQSKILIEINSYAVDVDTFCAIIMSMKKKIPHLMSRIVFRESI